MKRVFLGIFCALTACGGGVSPDAQPAATDAGPDVPPLAPQTLAMRGVDVYQSVQIPIMKDGAPVSALNAPIIAGRGATIRVAVKPDVGWRRKKIDATIVVASSGGTFEKKVTKEIGPMGSIDGAYESTFNFEVPKENFTRDASYSVTITNGAEQLARFPDTDTFPIGAVPSGTLKVKLVPVKYDADGSGRVPDVTADTIEMYRQNLFGMYPVSDVDISVHEPWSWSTVVEPDGAGWSDLLTAIVDLRNSESAPSDVYYYGLFMPQDSFWKYCREGCTAGLSNLVQENEAFNRGSIGLGYTDESSAKTMAHEIGHAHGRAHAPCGGPKGIDKKFPYSGGEIGVYGWDPQESQLIDPTFSDVMGYCYPVWVSDYTYSALFNRVSFVSKPKFVVQRSDAPTRYRFVHVEKNGHLRWGRATVMRDIPMSDPHTITFEAADGSKQTLTGHYYPYEDLAGGYMIVPEPLFPAVKLTIDTMPAGIERVLPLPK
jgi:hypothetical protein